MRYLLIVLGCIGCSDRTPNLISVDDLEALPNVCKVDVQTVKEAQYQIIHVLNWQNVNQEALEKDGDSNWGLYLQSALQNQQAVLLRALRDSYGVDTVFVEGLTEAEIKALDNWKKLPDVPEGIQEVAAKRHRREVLGAAA